MSLKSKNKTKNLNPIYGLATDFNARVNTIPYISSSYDKIPQPFVIDTLQTKDEC